MLTTSKSLSTTALMSSFRGRMLLAVEATAVDEAAQKNSLQNDNALRHVALRWMNPAFSELLIRTPIHPNPKTNVGRMLATKKEVHVPDLAAQPAYIEQREPGIVTAVEIGRVRTALYVPILKASELIGAIILARGEVRPFFSDLVGTTFCCRHCRGA